MSRFFRNADSSSSSSDSEDETEDKTSQLIVSDTAAPSRQGSEDALDLPTEAQANHRDLLLHALLEERCLRQAREHLGDHVGAARIQHHAQQHYQSLSQQLAAYGLVQPGLDHATLSARRQAVRNGLDMLSGSHLNAGTGSTDLALRRTGLPDVMQQLEIGLDALQLFRPQLAPPAFTNMTLPTNISDALLTLNSPNTLMPTPSALFSGSRYLREFEEVGTLGKGGYGIVYQCKHRFDGLSYAVKKVPLSTNRLQRIREQGQAEIDRLLLELTTLARLDHPNVVRYFGGWVEYATMNYRNLPHSEAEEEEEATFGASDHTGQSVSASRSWRSVGRETEGDFISFETSTSHSNRTNNDTEILQRQITHDTQPTVSDEDVENISRSLSTTADHSTLSNFVHDSRPCLALHIQMGLYPLTLADYISGTTIERKHCFHVESSVHILSALVDGIMYLHSQGVVHRDLKPANVFVAEQQQKQIWCSLCSGTSRTGVKVRIGDFGLVAALAQRDSDDLTVPVGTELYRPHDAVDRSKLEALDWFALGIMAFELLWPFSTRMERHETLSALKAGLYPHGFEHRLGDRAERTIGLLDCLLRSSHTVNGDVLHSMLTAMLASG